MGDVYTLSCLRSAELSNLSKAFDLRSLCYFKISVVMLLRYWNLAKSRVRTKKNALRPNVAYLNS